MPPVGRPQPTVVRAPIRTHSVEPEPEGQRHKLLDRTRRDRGCVWANQAAPRGREPSIQKGAEADPNANPRAPSTAGSGPLLLRPDGSLSLRP